MVIKFHDDWERRNLGMKKAIECIQSNILDILDRSQQFKHGVNEIATRVEANDQLFGGRNLRDVQKNSCTAGLDFERNGKYF